MKTLAQQHADVTDEIERERKKRRPTIVRYLQDKQRDLVNRILAKQLGRKWPPKRRAA